MPIKLPFVSLVVGIRFEWQRIKVYNDCKVGQRVWLLHNPQNPVDKNAIEVRVGSALHGMVGHLPAELSAKIFRKYPGFTTGEGVVILRGEDYDRKLDNRYCLNIKIERFE